jgi:hypothetical protein
MAFDNGYALLVGIGEYSVAEFSAPVTRNDAEALAMILIDASLAGYPAEHVQLLTGLQASRNGVLAALKSLATRTDAQSTVLLFFCGHGVSTEDGGYNFLTYDAQPTSDDSYDPSTVIYNTELVTHIKAIPARKTLILLNTCFSGVVAGNLTPITGHSADPGTSQVALPGPVTATAPPDKVLDEVLNTGEGRVIISACRPDQKSWYLKGDVNTLFVQALLEGLRSSEAIANRGGYIGVFELYQYVYDKVSSDARRILNTVGQEPVITIREGVGPFPIALYRGGQNLSPDVMPALDEEPAGPGVRIVPPVQAGRDFNYAADGSTVSTGDTHLTWGGDSFGGDKKAVDRRQSGGVTIGDNPRINGTVIGGDHYGSIFSGQFHGPVNQVQGNQTIAGRDIYQGGEALAKIFTDALQRIQEMPLGDQELATATLAQAQAQAEKLQQGDTSQETENAFERRLKALIALAPDVADAIISSLVSPVAGVATLIKKVAERISV